MNAANDCNMMSLMEHSRKPRIVTNTVLSGSKLVKLKQ